MQVVNVSQSVNVGVTLHCQVALLQDFVRLLFRQFAGLFLLVLALPAHEDLLELFREDIDVSGKQTEEITVVEVDVGVRLVLLVSTGKIDVHGIWNVLAKY